MNVSFPCHYKCSSRKVKHHLLEILHKDLGKGLWLGLSRDSFWLGSSTCEEEGEKILNLTVGTGCACLN